jgi:hypothetical protein
MCPRGSGSCLSTRGSSRAAMCHLGSSTHLLGQGEFCKLQANKQISLGNPSIMISIGAHARVSSKTLHDKGCSTCSQDM